MYSEDGDKTSPESREEKKEEKEMKTQIRKTEWSPAKEFLPIILGKQIGGKQIWK